MLWNVFRIARICLILLVLTFAAGGEALAQAGSGSALRWVEPQAGADLVKLKQSIEANGGKVLTLSPEGRLLVRYPAAARLAAVPGVASAQPLLEPAIEAQPAGRGLGARKPTPEAEAEFHAARVTSVEPNSLSKDRATLQGQPTLAASVDNSLSVYFPPIRSQGAQGSCVAWAAGYYYNTFTQASDELLIASSGDNNVICSPAFIYNIANEGLDDGLFASTGMSMLNRCGTCSWNSMVYSQGDFLTWPTEAAWIDALKRRTSTSSVIGNWYYGCNDSDILAIKQHLANGRLAITTADIFDNLYDHYPDDYTGVNNGVLFGPSAIYEGGHAMTIVGYDDDKPYYNGSTWKYGAFLLANSWGTDFGVENTGGTSTGFLWVAYDYFKTGHSVDYEVFGAAYFNTDRDNYRSRLYAAGGLNHASRGMISFNGGVGPATSPAWTSSHAINGDGGTATAINDGKRVVVDLNDGIPSIGMPYVNLFARMSVTGGGMGTFSNATFFHDFDGNGIYQQVNAANTPLQISAGAYADATAQFTWCDGSVNRLTWSAIGSPQAYQPFTATITARDTLDRAVTGFTGPVTLSGCADSTATVGSGASAIVFPFNTYWNVCRSTDIYLHSELGAATTWSGLQLNVTSLPGLGMTNFTVRMKHTSLANFDSVTDWDSSGWTTVYRHDLNVSNLGWVTLPFDTPFSYNGADNLLIDFSFYNSSYGAAGYVSGTETGVNRAIYANGDDLADPLTWSGASPAMTRYSSIPNIRLVNRQTVAVSPATTGNFTGGSWTGSLTITTAVNGMYILASDGAGHTGRSNLFNVAPGSPNGSLTVTMSPAEARAAGAMWRRSGQSSWRASGTTEHNIPPGNYTINFLAAPGWISPASQPVTITSGNTASVSAAYTQMSVVWVDFGFAGIEYGTQTAPYYMLDRAISAVTSGGLIYLKPGTSNQSSRITKPLRLESIGGTATIGRPF